MAKRFKVILRQGGGASPVDDTLLIAGLSEAEAAHTIAALDRVFGDNTETFRSKQRFAAELCGANEVGLFDVLAVVEEIQ